MIDELSAIIDVYQTLCDSEENQRRCGLWRSEIDMPEIVDTPLLFGRAPRPLDETGRPPIQAPVLPTVWCKVLGFNLRSYFTEPKVYLLYYLRSLVEQFGLGDDTALYRTISFWPGASYAPSLYGVETIHNDTDFPWLGKNQVIREHSDLAKLEHPDFLRSGLMPLAHQFYEECNELLRRSELRLSFPRIIRGPYGLAVALRGFNDLCLDLADDPEWVLKLMRFLTEGTKLWHEEWSRFTGEPLPRALLYEDEVDGNVIGPQTYETFALPFEREISSFLGGTVYWHSCGNVTKILELIGNIPGLNLLHVSAWTDYRAAARTCGHLPLELCIQAVEQLYQVDAAKVSSDLTEMVETCMAENVKCFTIRLAGVSPYHHSVEKDMEKIRAWIGQAKTCCEKGRK